MGQLVVAGERKARPRIGGDFVDHLAIAAFDQNVGNTLAQPQPLGDGEQMVLALGGGVFDQIDIAELLRVDQDRLSDRDRVVEASERSVAAARCRYGQGGGPISPAS